jgi:hypothetical protein
LFNEINSRKVNADGFNVFAGIFGNLYFVCVFVITIAIQLIMVEYGGNITNCTPLTG